MARLVTITFMIASGTLLLTQMQEHDAERGHYRWLRHPAQHARLAKDIRKQRRDSRNEQKDEATEELHSPRIALAFTVTQAFRLHELAQVKHLRDQYNTE